ncbi:unnamed protein product, partial [marine sediment metagenome]
DGDRGGRRESALCCHWTHKHHCTTLIPASQTSGHSASRRNPRERQDMIPSQIVREKAGLSQRRLIYMRKLGLIPRPTRIPRPGRHGSAFAYPATIFTRLHVIDFLQAHGFTLAQIAQSARGTPFEC